MSQQRLRDTISTFNNWLKRERERERERQREREKERERERERKPAAAKSLQSCLTLCDPIDSSPTGSSIRGILQARVLEWVAIAFSKGEA